MDPRMPAGDLQSLVTKFEQATLERLKQLEPVLSLPSLIKLDFAYAACPAPRLSQWLLGRDAGICGLRERHLPAIPSIFVDSY